MRWGDTSSPTTLAVEVADTPRGHRSAFSDSVVLSTDALRLWSRLGVQVMSSRPRARPHAPTEPEQSQARCDTCSVSFHFGYNQTWNESLDLPVPPAAVSADKNKENEREKGSNEEMCGGTSSCRVLVGAAWRTLGMERPRRRPPCACAIASSQTCSQTPTHVQIEHALALIIAACPITPARTTCCMW